MWEKHKGENREYFRTQSFFNKRDDAWGNTRREGVGSQSYQPREPKKAAQGSLNDDCDETPINTMRERVVFEVVPLAHTARKYIFGIKGGEI